MSSFYVAPTAWPAADRRARAALVAISLIAPLAAFGQDSGGTSQRAGVDESSTPATRSPKPPGKSVDRDQPQADDNPKSYVRYERSRLRIGGREGDAFGANVNLRLQFRFATPFTSAPRTPSQFSQPGEPDFAVRRARFKASGTAFGRWATYAFEHDIVDNRDYDARMTLSRLAWFQVRVGQWKVDYNREQMDSSGRQQFADRSIVNRAFTLSRQKGVSARGRVMAGTRGDSRYYVGIFTGNGRGWVDRRNLDHDDGSPMVAARYQWNFLGRDLDHSQSDIEGHDEPAAAVAFGAARNRSRFTRFSSGGGGQLDGFEAGERGQYILHQFLEETNLKYRGLSIQHELHWKRIKDTVNDNRVTRMRGAYVQAGYFPHHLWGAVPKQLELGGRHGFVDPDRARTGDMRREFTAVVNWFFQGHDNKLTLDATHFRRGSDLSANQVRLQWDVSF